MVHVGSGYSPLQRAIIWSYMTGPTASNTRMFQLPNSIQSRFTTAFHPLSIFIHFHSFGLKSSTSNPEEQQPRRHLLDVFPKKTSRRVLCLRCQVLLTVGTAKAWQKLDPDWPWPAENSEKTGKWQRSWKIRGVHPHWNRNMGKYDEFPPELEGQFSLQVPSVQTSNYSRHSTSDLGAPGRPFSRWECLMWSQE